MYLVTGAAGFIGSHIVRALNDRGITEIIAVDDLTQCSRFANLADCRIADYMDRTELRRELDSGAFTAPLKAIFHQGACTDTMETDGRYMMDNNFTFSKALLGFALTCGRPLVGRVDPGVLAGPIGGGTRCVHERQAAGQGEPE